MKKLALIVTFTLYAFSIAAQTNEAETTLIFVRHAEKMDDGTKDPSLNSDGKVRAERLASLMLVDFNISAVYSTPYKRTLETSKPISDSLNIPIQEYGLSDPKAFVQSIIEKHIGEEVLIVGHSNTTPLLANIALDSEKYEQFDEKTYGEILIVRIDANGSASSENRSY